MGAAELPRSCDGFRAANAFRARATTRGRSVSTRGCWTRARTAACGAATIRPELRPWTQPSALSQVPNSCAADRVSVRSWRLLHQLKKSTNHALINDLGGVATFALGSAKSPSRKCVDHRDSTSPGAGISLTFVHLLPAGESLAPIAVASMPG